ncbi:MAG: o-succinylbenzoate synthase [Chloroflexota bacterium]
MKPITVSTVKLYPVAMPLVERLGTSFGKEPFKTAILIRLETTDGIIGWGETSAEINPGYSYETMGTALHVLAEFLVPKVLDQTIEHPTHVPALLSRVRGHPLAHHGVEAAVWDAFAKTNEMSIADLFASALPEINGEKHKPRGHAHVGVSIGTQDSVEATLEIIRKRVNQGYNRIKLKIKPGWDLELAQGVRSEFPDVMLMLDANSAYSLDEIDDLKQLDDYDLLMLEQPLAYNDIYQHSKLQPKLETPVCLDESILTLADAQLAIELGSCKIINLKPARVSGYTESLKIYQFCAENKVPLWIGGLLETGVGRATNLAFASLPAVTLPCDISATDRYYDPDLAEPTFSIRPDSTIAVPEGIGIGVEVQMDRVMAATAYLTENMPYPLPGVEA